MKTEKTIQNQQGFTFIELMITTTVVAVVVLGFLGSATALQSANKAAYERSVALQDANQVIELMRNASATGTFPACVTSTYSGTVSGYSNLSGEAVSVAYANASANPLDATVTVSYNENSTRATSVAIRTYITQRA